VTRLRAAAAVAAGLVLAAAGGGFGIPRLAKDRWGVTTVLGLLVLAVGLGLAAWGTVWLFRAAHGLWRVGVVLAVSAAAYVVVPTIGIAVAATHAPRPHLGDATPTDVGLEYTDVEFPAADGVRLSGWYVPSRNGDAVVLLHGAGSTRTAVIDHARVLAALGYGVLLYDARGHGRSGGRAMEFGWDGDADVAGAVRFVRRRPDAAAGRVSAVGMSMGGEEALGALAATPDLCSVVAEGATGRTAADKAWLSDAYGVRGFAQEGLDRLMYGVTDLLTPSGPPRSLRASVAAAAPRRALLIAARRVADEPKAAAYIAGGSGRSVEVWVVPGAGHTGALEARRAEWIQRVGDFLARAEC
jgi:pimeloyl-ACP methyl ester carboxylesterase